MPEDKNERWRRLADRLQARWEARLAERRKAENPGMPGTDDSNRGQTGKPRESLGQIQMICAGMAPGSVTEAAERILQKADDERPG